MDKFSKHFEKNVVSNFNIYEFPKMKKYEHPRFFISTRVDMWPCPNSMELEAKWIWIKGALQH